MEQFANAEQDVDKESVGRNSWIEKRGTSSNPSGSYIHPSIPYEEWFCFVGDTSPRVTFGVLPRANRDEHIRLATTKASSWFSVTVDNFKVQRLSFWSKAAACWFHHLNRRIQCVSLNGCTCRSLVHHVKLLIGLDHRYPRGMQLGDLRFVCK